MTEDELILTHILQCKPIDLHLNKLVLTVLQQKKIDEYKRRRQEGEPLQYILGTCNFMGLELTVNSSVLIPRPETEQLVDTALKEFKSGVALDLGTGSGNIAIALAKFVPQSKLVSIDISAKALEVARVNARSHGVLDQINFICEDMLVILSKAKDLKEPLDSSTTPQNDNKFDLIISNPPYIPTEQLSHLPLDVQEEPVRALDGGSDGLNFYRNIIKYTPHLLRTGACLMMEFGDGQAEAIKELFQAEEAFSNITIFQDLAGRDRIVKAVL